MANMDSRARYLIAVYRFGRWARSLGIPVVRALPRAVARVLRWTCQIGLQADVSPAAEIGANVRFGHGGSGVVINGSARIGDDVVIYHRVTIGSSKGGAPTIGDRVFIGSGACILGPVVVGAGARIGANAVVVEDVPAGATAVGVPAHAVGNDTPADTVADEAV